MLVLFQHYCLKILHLGNIFLKFDNLYVPHINGVMYMRHLVKTQGRKYLLVLNASTLPTCTQDFFLLF